MKYDYEFLVSMSHQNVPDIDIERDIKASPEVFDKTVIASSIKPIEYLYIF